MCEIKTKKCKSAKLDEKREPFMERKEEAVSRTIDGAKKECVDSKSLCLPIKRRRSPSVPSDVTSRTKDVEVGIYTFLSPSEYKEVKKKEPIRNNQEMVTHSRPMTRCVARSIVAVSRPTGSCRLRRNIKG